MTLRHLQIFIEVYQNKSITKAADKLHLAQPSISLAIKELEEYYHIQLFDRMNRRIYPTSHAEKFYQYALHIISLYSQMEQGLSHWEESGTIKIGSSITISNYILPNLLKLFKGAYPDLKLQVFINNSQTIEQLLLKNEIDFALVETELNEESIIHVPFMSDYLTTIVDNVHPLLNLDAPTLDHLKEYPFLMREPGSSVYDLVSSIFLINDMKMNIIMESSSTQAIIKSVESGIGISTLPYMLVKEAIEEERIKALKIPQLNIKRQYNVVYHKNKYISKVALHLFDLCKQYGKELNIEK